MALDTRAGCLWHKTTGVATPRSIPLHQGGEPCLQYNQTATLPDVDGGLAGVVHVEDVGLLDCHRAIGQIVAPEDSGALADLQLNLRCLVQSDLLHPLYLDRACTAKCPVKGPESEVSTPARSQISSEIDLHTDTDRHIGHIRILRCHPHGKNLLYGAQ